MAVIRTLYDKAAVSLRTDADEKGTEPFKQKNGIRQGSSLSPLIFVLVLDFCMRVIEAAIGRGGILGPARPVGCVCGRHRGRDGWRQGCS